METKELKYDRRIKDAASFLWVHKSFSLFWPQTISDLGRTPVDIKWKLKPANGRSCYEIWQEVKNDVLPGLDFLLQLYRKEIPIPAEFVGKRIVFFKEIFKRSRENDPFCFVLNLERPEPDFSHCRLYDTFLGGDKPEHRILKDNDFFIIG
jgi:hypothetical protein